MLDVNGCSYMDTDCEERYGLTDLSMQSLLMNHTGVVGSLAVHLDAARDLSYLGLPYTLDEVNGMALQGGAWTWSMGSALWVVDFALWSATNVSHYRLLLRTKTNKNRTSNASTSIKAPATAM